MSGRSERRNRWGAAATIASLMNCRLADEPQRPPTYITGFRADSLRWWVLQDIADREDVTVESRESAAAAGVVQLIVGETPGRQLGRPPASAASSNPPARAGLGRQRNLLQTTSDMPPWA
jgi:hypothetical protein